MLNVSLYSTPSLQAGCDIQSIFKGSTAGLNSESSFSKTGCPFKAKENSLLYYLLIAVGERRDGFLLFLRA